MYIEGKLISQGNIIYIYMSYLKVLLECEALDVVVLRAEQI